MGSATATPKTATRVELTRIPDSWAWIKPDIAVRLLPFTVLFAIAYLASRRARWLGLETGDLRVQLLFAAVGVPVMFVAATTVQLWLARRRGALLVPANAGDAWFQAGVYAGHRPIGGGVFRRVVPGGPPPALGNAAAVGDATAAALAL